MAVTVVDRAKKKCTSYLAGLTLKAMLVNVLTPNAGTQHVVSDVSGTEISGNGYARVALTSLASSEDNTNHWGKLTSATISFGAVGPVSGQAITHLIVYDDAGGADSARDIIAIYDCVASLNSGSFSCTVDANGLLTLS